MRRAFFCLLPFVAACHDSDSDPAPTAFAPLVGDLIQNQTSESGAPIDVNGAAFSFPTDEAAFDGVLPSDTGAVVEQ
jgi:hypothetical protein